MAGLNKVMIIGNVGTDPEMRYTPNGNPVTSFRMATSRNYTAQDGERKQDTEWFTVVTWNQLAEQCNQFLAKGRRAYVEGRLNSQEWVGENGQPRFRNEIVANRVLFLDKAPSASPGPQEEFEKPSSGEVRAQTSESPGPIEPDDLPF